MTGGLPQNSLFTVLFLTSVVYDVVDGREGNVCMYTKLPYKDR